VTLTTGSRIVLASGTRAPTAHEALLFYSAVFPKERCRAWWAEVTCVGDVMDTPLPEGCIVRKLQRKRATGDTWFRSDPCKKLTCPYCVGDALARTAGAAWVAWNRRANVVEVVGHKKDRRKAERNLGIRWRGEDATIGALAVPTAPDTRVLFWPGRPSPPGAVLRGQMLERELTKALRAIPIEEKFNKDGDEEREPSLTYANIPRELSNADVERVLTEVTGTDWKVFSNPKGYGHMQNVSNEQWFEIVERLWLMVRAR
jgi:hypothetical protein